jgi:acyl carrier protein
MNDVEAASLKLREFLAREVLANRTADSIDPDADLVAIGLDSLALLRLVLFLETEYGVEVVGADILGEGLTTVRQIAEHCCRRGK